MIYSRNGRIFEYRKRIVAPRRFFLTSVVLSPFLVAVVVQFLGEAVLPILFFLWAGNNLVLLARVLAHSSCPWCGGAFYWRGGRVNGGFSIFYVRRCVNCGEPR